MSDLFTCAICSAVHPQPAATCRRCGADLLLLARIRACAQRLRAAGLDGQAQALAGDQPAMIVARRT